MEHTITIELEIPQEWVADLQDQATLLEVLGLGLQERRFRRALALYEAGAGSLGYVAELVGLSKHVLMEEARKRGIHPQYDEHFVDQDLGQ